MVSLLQIQVRQTCIIDVPDGLVRQSAYITQLYQVEFRAKKVASLADFYWIMRRLFIFAFAFSKRGA